MTLIRRYDELLINWRKAVNVYVCICACIGAWLLSACTDNSKVQYAEFVDIPTNGWNNKEFCEFVTATVDSAMFDDANARYNLILTIRHTDMCPYNELFLPAVQSVDTCTALPDTLHIVLADKSGAWLGKHSKGIYTLTDTILRGTHLPPLYSLRLFHSMPCENLTGLISVGLIIEEN